jgi:hypothetical protein
MANSKAREKGVPHEGKHRLPLKKDPLKILMGYAKGPTLGCVNFFGTDEG